MSTSIEEVKAYTLTMLKESYQLSESHWRSEIRGGRLKAKKIGRRVIVLASSLDEYFEGNPDWTPGEAPAAANAARRMK